MKYADGRAAVLAASPVVALSGAGKGQEGYFEDVRPVSDLFGGESPCLSDDGLEIFFTSWRPGGSGLSDLYVAWRSAKDEPWRAERALVGLNTPSWERSPSISADGLKLYFDTDGIGGPGGRDIFVAQRERRWDEDKDGNRVPAPFGKVQNLIEVNSSYADGNPDISQDGLELFFSSTRPGGRGDNDLYVASRPTTHEPSGEPTPFGEPRPLVNLNSGGNENSPSISCDGLTLLFGRPSRDSPPGLGQVMVARRENRDPEFGMPQPLGLPVNSGDLYWGGIPDISCDWPADGALLYFVRIIGGIPLIYQATWRLPALFLRGDSNADGRVDISDAVRTLGWLFLGAEEPGCLSAAELNGEKPVDLSDPVYLLSHLFLGGPPPPAPFPECGPLDPSADGALGCKAAPKGCQ